MADPAEVEDYDDWDWMEREAGYGGAFDGVGTVISDADPGL